eukprot:9618142-Alexandrium_andersonii.AAC.1
MLGDGGWFLARGALWDDEGLTVPLLHALGGPRRSNLRLGDHNGNNVTMSHSTTWIGVRGVTRLGLMVRHLHYESLR